MGNTPAPTYNASGKIAIVTGANTGIGKATAIQIAKSQISTLVLACRTSERAAPVIEEIKNVAPECDVEVIPVDLGNYESVKNFVKTFKEKHDHLDILVNNAGLFTTKFGRSEVSGLENMFTVNHIGTFLLTTLLLDSLEKAKKTDETDSINGPRIVLVASEAHTFCGPLNSIEQIEGLSENSFGGITDNMKVYGLSKLSNLLFGLELNRRIKEYGSKISVHCVHPGWVKTDLGRERGDGLLAMAVNGIEAVVARTPEEGAIPSVFAACSPSLNGTSGGYWVGANSTWAVKDYAKDEEAAKKLWEFTEQKIGNQVDKWL